MINKKFSLIMPLGIFLAGCGYHPKLMPQIEPLHYAHKIENEKIQIFVEPFDTKEECREIFQHNVNSRAYLPVFIRIKNASENSEIKIDRDNFHFYSRDGVEWAQIDGMRMARSYESEGAVKSTLMGFLFGAASGMLSAINEQEKNSARVQDFENKGLSAVEQVIPGGVEEGFVYFRKQNKHSMSEKEFEKSIMGSRFSFEVFFSSEEIENYSFNFGNPSNWAERQSIKTK